MTWPGQDLHKLSRADSLGSLDHFRFQWVLCIPPFASSFELMNLECAILPPSLAFACAVALPSPSSLLCLRALAQFHLLQEAPLAVLRDPAWVRVLHGFGPSGPYLSGAVCRGLGCDGGAISWQGAQHALISHVTPASQYTDEKIEDC